MKRPLLVTANILAALAAASATLWGAAALVYAGPASPAFLANAAAAAWCLAMAAAPLRRRSVLRATPVWAALFALLLVWYSTVRPSNDRDWIEDVSRPPHADLDGDRLVVHDVRDFAYRSESDWTAHWEDRTYDLSKIEGLDLFLSYWGPRDIAHTILSWEFSDGRHLAISIETRKEKGEEYDPVASLFRRYELFYVVADERDVVALRTNVRGENVFLYRLAASPERARRLLLDYVEAMNALAGTPVFYNALTTNCTTSIRDHVLRLGVAMPWDPRVLRNGYIDRMLQEAGSIAPTLSYDELRHRSSIDERAKAAAVGPDFSARIREGLPARPSRRTG